MKICIRHPDTYIPERRYIYDVIFKEFLGLDYILEMEDRKNCAMTLANDDDDREILLPDNLFQTPYHLWLSNASLPKRPLEIWDVSSSPLDPVVVDSSVPVIYGERLSNGEFYEITETKIRLGLDIFGSAFFMLTRYEEVVKTDRDERERFPARASLAYQEGFLTRPIINEYVEILWCALKRLWPNLVRKERHFQVRLSHDVDRPLGIYGQSFHRVAKATLGDAVKRKDFDLAFRRLHSWVQVQRGDVDKDIYNTFDFIMNLSEKNGLKSAFYFIADHTAGIIDGNYSIENPWIRKLLGKIHKRGHEIGLHPSYNTFRNPEQIKVEFEKLLKVAHDEGIQQTSWGGRQHYLRWEAPTTWQAWEEAGLTYDSTLSYADHAGFRCGVCYEYPVFNVKTRKSLQLRERPLIVMEQTLLAYIYMGLSIEQAHEDIQNLMEKCKMFHGDFTLLWHNSHLIARTHQTLYEQVMMHA